MAFEWTADLSINVGDIDRQHQEIFVRYNAFIDACKEGEGKADLSDLLEFLTAYVNEHFEHEEKFMRDYKYPGKITHVKEHKELIQTVQKFKTRLALNGATVSLITELNQSLVNWLTDHIKRSDMELGGFLNQKWGIF